MPLLFKEVAWKFVKLRWTKKQFAASASAYHTLRNRAMSPNNSCLWSLFIEVVKPIDNYGHSTPSSEHANKVCVNRDTRKKSKRFERLEKKVIVVDRLLPRKCTLIRVTAKSWVFKMLHLPVFIFEMSPWPCVSECGSGFLDIDEAFYSILLADAWQPCANFDTTVKWHVPPIP